MPKKRTPALLSFQDRTCEMTLDGCGSACDSQCPAMMNGLCRGCTSCDFNNTCPKGGCGSCWVRCWRREDIADWIEDVGGLEYKTVGCCNPFTGELPLYVPQIRDNAYNTEYPAYIMNGDRIVHKSSRRWLYQKQGVHHHCHIPASAKVISSFCLKDSFLEEIWGRSLDFQDGETFWDGLAKYDFAASISIEYSCYANQPRMEHAINIKRNILSAHKLAEAGIPVILDAMFHTDQDLERLLGWAKENGLVWFVLNFQYTKRLPWVMEMIRKKMDTILSVVPRAKILVMGIGDTERIALLGKEYAGKVSVANAVVCVNTAYHRIYQPENDFWAFTDEPLDSLFAKNLRLYVDDIRRKI